MKCPSCNFDIEFTWKVYFLNPFGRFTCPNCSFKFKFDRPVKYYLWQIASMGFYFLLLLMLIAFLGPERTLLSYVIASSIYLACYFSIDKRIESKYGTKPR